MFFQYTEDIECIHLQTSHSSKFLLLLWLKKAIELESVFVPSHATQVCGHNKSTAGDNITKHSTEAADELFHSESYEDNNKNKLR